MFKQWRYRLKSILITGSNGFLGSNLINKLENKYRLFKHTKSDGDLKSQKNFPVVDYVIHLAASSNTNDFYQKPIDVIKNNFLSTLNLVEFYKKQKKKPIFVFSSTAEITNCATDLFNFSKPTDENVPFVINDLSNPRWSYASSKVLCEQIIMLSGLKFIILRIYNIYGPGQRGNFIYDFIKRSKKKKINLYGWNNSRSWLFIDDLSFVIEKLFKTKKAINQIINIGDDKEYKVIEIAKIILKELNLNHQIIKKSAPKGSPKRRIPNIRKLKKLINWKPNTNILVGIKKTVKSMNSNLK